ncbi:unnamed protein product [Diamesa serratosioi]
MKYLLLLLMVNLVFAKQYQRCELAKELIEKHNVGDENVGMLVCFAELTSKLNTQSYWNQNYGLLKLNGRVWCSENGEKGGGCDMDCADLLDDDITDDIKCAKTIIAREGLDAWRLTRECLQNSNDIVNECIRTKVYSNASSESDQNSDGEVEPISTEIEILSVKSTDVFREENLVDNQYSEGLSVDNDDQSDDSEDEIKDLDKFKVLETTSNNDEKVTDETPNKNTLQVLHHESRCFGPTSDENYEDVLIWDYRTQDNDHQSEDENPLVTDKTPVLNVGDRWSKDNVGSNKNIKNSYEQYPEKNEATDQIPLEYASKLNDFLKKYNSQNTVNYKGKPLLKDELLDKSILDVLIKQFAIVQSRDGKANEGANGQ